MEGFLVLGQPVVGDDRADALQARLAARGWRLVRTAPAGRLFVLGDTPVRDLARGWIVGELFVRGTGRPAPLAVSAAADAAEAACASLVRDYWGRYVAIFPEARSIFRDPSGHMDGLVWRTAAGWVMGSEAPPELPSEILPTDLAIDWPALAAIAAGRMGPGVSLGLNGISPVQPGMLKTIGSKTADRMVWRPSAFARQPHASYEASRVAVARAVEESLSAEIGSQAPLLAEISGGLDSAIVATTLARLGAGPRTRFVNFHVADPAGDERPFARAVAAKAGVDLVEIGKPELRLDEAALSALPIGARPPFNAIDRHYDAAVAEQARHVGARRILTGQGGDMVFFQSPSSRVVGELWGRWARRPRADPLWRQLEAAARWNRRSVWSLLGEAAVEALRGPPPEPWDHPWLDQAVAPAKQRQIRSLARAQVFHGPSLRGRQARLVHPLLHQPVLEAVLAAPVVDLARNGRGRGLARDVFAAQLPVLVSQRRSKGDLTAYYGRMVLRSLPALGPYLIEGRLVQERVLDRAGLEGLLDPDRLIHEGDYPRLFEIVALEAFVRYWEGRLSSRAGAGAGPSRSASHGRTTA